jgi:hypothetical protein
MTSHRRANTTAAARNTAFRLGYHIVPFGNSDAFSEAFERVERFEKRLRSGF